MQSNDRHPYPEYLNTPVRRLGLELTEAPTYFSPRSPAFRVHYFLDHIRCSGRATFKSPLPSQGVHGGFATFRPSRTDRSATEVSADDSASLDVEVRLGPGVDM